MAGRFGHKGAGKKKLFDDRAPAAKKNGGAAAAREHQLEMQRHANFQQAIDYNPRDRYPMIRYPISPLPTVREHAIIEKWKADRKKIREGPLFVRRVVDGSSRVQKSTGAATGGWDAFNSLQTYSARYERKYRMRPKIEGKLWLKAFLPKELWDVVDPSLRKGRANKDAANAASAGGKQVNGDAAGTKAAVTKPPPPTRFNINEFSDAEDEPAADDANEKNDVLDDSDAEAEAEADEVDEDWEDDEDEGDDYNGEKYFDDGDGDDVVGDDYEAGDDLGGGEVEHEREFAVGEEFDV